MYPEFPYTLEVGSETFRVEQPDDPTYHRVRRPDGQVTSVDGDSSLELTAEALAAWLATPPVVPPPPVPESVGPAQLRIAIRHLHGITSGAVYAVISAIPDAADQDDARDLWEYATVIRRDHPLIASLAAAFELASAQIDDVFRLAATF